MAEGKNEEMIVEIRGCIHDINNQLTVLKAKAEKMLDEESLNENKDLLKIFEKTNNIIELVCKMRDSVLKIE